MFSDTGALEFNDLSATAQTNPITGDVPDLANKSLSGDCGCALSGAEWEKSISQNLQPTEVADGDFINNLPDGYDVYGALAVRPQNPEVATVGGLYGAPKPNTGPEDEQIFGNPNTLYSWIYTDVEGIGFNVTAESQDDSFIELPPSFVLDGDDALVLYGRTPPREALSYYSLNLYHTLLPYEESEVIPGYGYIGTSIELSKNQANLRTTASETAPFDSLFAVIVTSSTQTRDAVRRSLVNTGVPFGAINSYFFPKEFADAGTSETPSVLSFLFRHTYQTKEELAALENYLQGIRTIQAPFEFSAESFESYGDEDQGAQVTVSEEGTAAEIIGNGWKKVDFSYNITENTILEFDFRSDVEGDVHGIGFDNDNTISFDRFFKLHGIENLGIDDYDTYSSPGTVQRFQIPVGEFFTGEVNSLTLINDHDVSDPNAQSIFSNLKVYEAVPEPTIKAAFVKGPGVEGNVSGDRLPEWEDTLRTETIEYDLGLDQKLEDLQANVVDTYTSQGYQLREVLVEEMNYTDPEFCRSEPYFCGYNSPDALYTYFTGGSLNDPFEVFGSYIRLEDNDDFAIMIGVDHTLVGDEGLATYFSYESKAVEFSNPQTFSFTGALTAGSAEQYVSPDAAEDLFTVKMVRSNEFGAGQPYTVNIPYKEGTTPEENQFALVGRIYLDPVTASAPNPANLIPRRVLWFEKVDQDPSSSSASRELSIAPPTVAASGGAILLEDRPRTFGTLGVALPEDRNGTAPLVDFNDRRERSALESDVAFTGEGDFVDEEDELLRRAEPLAAESLEMPFGGFNAFASSKLGLTLFPQIS